MYIRFRLLVDLSMWLSIYALESGFCGGWVCRSWMFHWAGVELHSRVGSIAFGSDGWSGVGSVPTSVTLLGCPTVGPKWPKMPTPWIHYWKRWGQEGNFELGWLGDCVQCSTNELQLMAAIGPPTAGSSQKVFVKASCPMGEGQDSSAVVVNEPHYEGNA